jgi:hypothetical protein
MKKKKFASTCLDTSELIGICFLPNIGYSVRISVLQYVQRTAPPRIERTDFEDVSEEGYAVMYKWKERDSVI